MPLPTKYQKLMRAIGPFTEQIFFMLISTHPHDWNRTAKGILSLTKTYPTTIVELSCKRALVYNVCQYQVIKNICQNGCYNLPIDFEYQLEYSHINFGLHVILELKDI